jgi:LEA14-like dessication related protein
MKAANLLVLVVIVALCSACGPRQVKGQPPFVSISSMTVNGDTLAATFNVRNINDVPMDIDSVDITIRIRNAELTRHQGALTLSVDPNTTEEVAVEKLPEQFARELLDTLESGETNSLPFFLEGRIHTAADGFMPFRHEGHLYPVPGRPGHFRSASSRTRERD